MKIFAAIAAASVLTNIALSNIYETMPDQKNQVLIIPDREISFERGSYKIVKESFTPKSKLTDDELERILITAGFSGYGLKMAKAIVFYESTNRPMALNKSSSCYGLFQINMSGSLGDSRIKKYNLGSREDLYNPLINARIAYQMSKGGKDWSAWSTERVAKQSIN